MFLLDLLPIGTGTAILAVAFFFVIAATGVVVFILLRKTVKMAIRMLVVAAVFLIAVVGSIALWKFMAPTPNDIPRPRPAVKPAR